MIKNEIIRIKEGFIEVHRKTKTKDVPCELYYIVMNTMLGLHLVKLSKRNGLDKNSLDYIYNPYTIPCANIYFDFSKYGTEWEINKFIGTTDNVSKEFILRNY
jgi:hypothetical protein